jgi:hypothetical protein
MNAKFEDLMYQAGLTAQGCWDEMDSYDHEAIEKFAELIVRECADIVNKKVALMLKTEMYHIEPGIFIKQHFGVDPPPLLVRQVTIEEAIMSSGQS